MSEAEEAEVKKPEKIKRKETDIIHKIARAIAQDKPPRELIKETVEDITKTELDDDQMETIQILTSYINIWQRHTGVIRTEDEQYIISAIQRELDRFRGRGGSDYAM